MADIVVAMTSMTAAPAKLPGKPAEKAKPFKPLDELISGVRSLTAAVIRVANSAKFGTGDTRPTLAWAVTRLGMREVYRVVLEIVTAPGLKGPDAALFGKVDLWQHSLATAVASQVLSERLTHEDNDVVFSAGLLHDIGKMVLVRAARKEYVV